VLAAFWSGLGGELAKQWMVRILTPAFAFWAGGLAAVWWHANRAGVGARGWSQELADTAKALQALPALSQVMLLLGALVLLAASALIAERLTFPLLRLLEGYWSRPRWLWSLLVRLRGSQRDRWAERIAPLQTRQRRGTLDVAEFRELRRLEASAARDPERLDALRRRRAEGLSSQDAARLYRGLQITRRTPEQRQLQMPTRLGNILRSAEQRPMEKYGLDSVVCWTALWLVLPEQTRTQLVQARSTLDNATRMWLWGALFVVWTPWTWWAVPIAVLVPTLAYHVGMLGAATLFGDLVVTAFDLHRMNLYDSLHLPRPTSPVEERAVGGPRVTNALWGGLDEPSLRYTAGTAPAGGA
jgi:hypothetical protein